ncbi:hypothetical protein PAEPH01_2342 [Pancytospora epiphaga]|nr:hypothetical protein PAEPH01_2342 [Pancytospora epiphaga]
MLKEIYWLNCDFEASLPEFAVIKLISNKPLLQRVEMFVVNLSAKLAKVLSGLRYLHTLNLQARNYSKGFFEVLSEESGTGKSMLKWINIYFTIIGTESTLSIRDMNAIGKMKRKGVNVILRSTVL